MNKLLSLLQLSDPALPIGGFSHSAGLETYVQYGIVKDRKTAEEFVRQQLSVNIHYTDAAFVSLAYDAAEQNDLPALVQLDEECTAVKLPREMRQASQKLGLRLLKIFLRVCPHSFAEQYKMKMERSEAAGHYPLVFGLYSFLLGIPKSEALSGFYYNSAAGMVTSCVKLVPLGQQDGQEILFSLQELMGELVNGSLNPDREMTGLCCTGFDIRCMQHEQLYSRLYMS
jgi:urease accessory protein